MVGCEARVGERSDVLGLELVVELDHGAGARLEVLGVAAVDVDTWEQGGLAVDVVAEAAGFAEPTGD